MARSLNALPQLTRSPWQPGARGWLRYARRYPSVSGQIWDLLTPDDVCALLKVKKSWLYDAVENGAIEAIRLGKQLRFRPSALVRYLEERVSNGNGRG